jgi:hypothetical protein
LRSELAQTANTSRPPGRNTRRVSACAVVKTSQLVWRRRAVGSEHWANCIRVSRKSAWHPARDGRQPERNPGRQGPWLASGEPCGLSRHAVVTGVVFFDSLHVQDYVAPNGIELHPLLSFGCLR